VPRSQICTACFAQYCYDPQHPPSKDALPGRKYDHLDPDPQGVSKVKNFLANEKGSLIGGIVGLLVFVGVLVGGL
jgi:lysophospholipase